MRKNAVLINSSRGGVVYKNALIHALQNNEIAAAGLDVLEKEPPELKNPLLKMEKRNNHTTRILRYFQDETCLKKQSW